MLKMKFDGIGMRSLFTGVFVGSFFLLSFPFFLSFSLAFFLLSLSLF